MFEPVTMVGNECVILQGPLSVSVEHIKSEISHPGDQKTGVAIHLLYRSLLEESRRMEKERVNFSEFLGYPR